MTETPNSERRPPFYSPSFWAMLRSTTGAIQRRDGVSVPSAASLQAVKASVDRLNEARRRFDEWGKKVLEEHQRTAKLLKQWKTAHEHFLALLIEMGWPPTGELPIGTVNRIVELEKAGQLDREDLVVSLLNFYDADRLLDLAAGWGQRDWLKPRVQILTAAVEAHIAGQYELSVPAILPQVEGLIGEASGHATRMHGGHLEDYVENLLGDEYERGFRDAIRTFWMDTVLHDFEWGGAAPELSRHAILHGFDTDYAEESKSLRVILLFHLVQDCIQYVATAHGHAYHRPDCGHLGPPRGGREIFVAHYELDRRPDLAPCKTCVGR